MSASPTVLQPTASDIIGPRKHLATWVYGAAHFGKSLFWYTSEILFAFFLTEITGLSGRAMGLLLAVGLLGSIAIDLALARVLRRQLGELTYAARLQMAGAALSSLALAALFVAPMLANGVSPLLWAALAMLAFRFSYALYDLPQNLMLSLATSTDRARGNVASLRLFCSGLAVLAVTASVAPLVAAGGIGSVAQRFVWLALVIATLALASAWLLWRVLGAQHAPVQDAAPLSTSTSLRSPKRWPVHLQVLLAATFVTALTTSMFAKLEPYFTAYVVDAAMQGGLMITAMALGMTLSQPAWAALMHRRSADSAFVLAAWMMLGATLVFLLSAGQQLVLAMLAATLIGAANGGFGSSLWAGFAHAVARHLQRAQGGTAYALFVGLSKLGLALSGLLLGEVLHSVDYRDSQSHMILYGMTLWPALGAVVCLGLALRLRTVKN